MMDATQHVVTAALTLIKQGRDDEVEDLLLEFEADGPGAFELMMKSTKIILDDVYPASIFTGVSRDSGSKLVAALREALNECEDVLAEGRKK